MFTHKQVTGKLCVDLRTFLSNDNAFQNRVKTCEEKEVAKGPLMTLRCPEKQDIQGRQSLSNMDLLQKSLVQVSVVGDDKISEDMFLTLALIL